MMKIITKSLIPSLGLFTILVLFLSCIGRQNTPEKLLGHWKEYKTHTVEGDSLNWVGKPYVSDIEIVLMASGKGLNKEYDNESFDYSVSFDTLIIGNRKYIIDSLKANVLLLRDYDPDFPDDPDALVHHLKKVSGN